MAVVRTSDRISNIVETALMERVDPVDHVEWEVVTAMDYDCECDTPEDNSVMHGSSMVVVYMALDCPELDEGDTAFRSVAEVGFPLRSSDERVREMVHEMWENVCARRLEYANGLTG